MHRRVPWLVCRQVQRRQLSAVAREECLKNKNRYGQWLPTIGLEIHAQINSDSKLFSVASTNYSTPPNCNVNLFDASHPGTLPVLNRKCVEAAITTGLALNCSIAEESSFDRKHYFYADMPSGYQITQQRQPIAIGGHVDFVVYNSAYHKSGYQKRNLLKQIQLEQDSGKSLHDSALGRSLIDLNRAGVGLMELVFEPELEDGDEAYALIRELVQVLRLLDTCSCKMEEGSLRVDANISVRRTGDTELGTRTEVKNLNSLKAISRAIDYEIRRQIATLESGGTVINDTRMYNSAKQATFVMRDKGVDHDYRFMPEPNLPPLRIGSKVPELANRLPKLPASERSDMVFRCGEGLPIEHVQEVVHSSSLAEFTQIMDEKPTRDPTACYRILNEILPNILDERKLSLIESGLSLDFIGKCVDFLQLKLISGNNVRDALIKVLDEKLPQKSLQEMIAQFEWQRINDKEEIRKACDEAITASPKKARAYSKKGKSYALGLLMNRVRKNSKGRIDDRDARELFDQILTPPATSDEELAEEGDEQLKA